MAKYNLKPDESVILRSEKINHGGFIPAFKDELILTNQNIIHLSKGLIGNTKNVTKYPLSKIKLYNGEPQVFFEKKKDGNYQLVIYFLNGQERFGFAYWNKKDGAKWFNAIYKIITGNELTKISSNPLIPGREHLVGTFKEAVRTFKSGLVGNTKINKIVTTIEKVTKNCISCSAPLTDNKGKTVHCRYCDTAQVL